MNKQYKDKCEICGKYDHCVSYDNKVICRDCLKKLGGEKSEKNK